MKVQRGNALPFASKYIEGNPKTINAANHHGIMQTKERRAPVRHPKTIAEMQQIARHAKPTRVGHKRIQKCPLAPSGLAKYE
jgi:hypothetical protein